MEILGIGFKQRQGNLHQASQPQDLASGFTPAIISLSINERYW